MCCICAENTPQFGYFASLHGAGYKCIGTVITAALVTGSKELTAQAFRAGVKNEGPMTGVGVASDFH